MPLKESGQHCHSHLTGQPMRECPWMKSEGPSQTGHLSPCGNQTLTDDDMPFIPETTIPETDLRNRAGSLA